MTLGEDSTRQRARTRQQRVNESGQAVCLVCDTPVDAPRGVYCAEHRHAAKSDAQRRSRAQARDEREQLARLMARYSGDMQVGLPPQEAARLAAALRGLRGANEVTTRMAARYTDIRRLADTERAEALEDNAKATEDAFYAIQRGIGPVLDVLVNLLSHNNPLRPRKEAP